MIRRTDPDMTKPSASAVPSGRYATRILRALLIAAGVAILCIVLFLSLGRVRLSQIGMELAISFAYSVSIALPSMFLLMWIGQHYTERFPRLIYLFHSLVLLGTGTIGTLASGLLIQAFGIVPRGGYWSFFWSNIPFTMVITLVVGLSLTSFETLRYKFQAATLELRTRQVEQERAYKLLAEARLSSLESRIHPHFLFNTLNSIAALIPSDPVRAEDTVGKLASLLRFSLNANHTGLVPLSQELKIVRDYLEIEKTRFGPRLRYEIDVPEALDSVKVPPLALQSLVENSVKHVVSKRTQGAAIHVAGSIIEANGSSHVCLEVSDDGPGFTLDVIAPEHGLGNLVARLELLYGSAGQLDVDRVDGKPVVRLTFPA
jgi:sensor histidine kinase YesM